MNVRIGTSGYSYPDWAGTFYPEGLRPQQRLPFYCRHFPLVELNFTFYRAPTADMLGRLAEKTPAGFQFLVKLPQTISHEQSPRDLDGFRAAALELDRRGRLSGLVCQLPQSTHDDRRSRAWIETVGRALGDLRLAVEFRHRSWARPGLSEWMGEQGLDLVAVDVPDLPGLFPRGWVQAGGRAYVRLHSRNARAWYAGEKQRYDYQFTDEQLGEWVDAAVHASESGGTERTLFLFNNCHRSQAVVNARRMQALLDCQAAALHVVPPPAAALPVQRTLFE